MPEGDTIWRTAAALRPRMLGETVRSAEPVALHRLAGRRVTAVDPVGKHLMIHFDNDLVLHTHMRMTGAWHVYPAGWRWQKPARRARAVLRFDRFDAVLFSAPTVELIRDTSAVTGRLGPDILVEPFDVEAVVARARRSARTAIGEVLLDQSVCAGIGNIYRCEALWLRRVDPWAPVERLDDSSMAEVYLAARGLIRDGAMGGGRRPRTVHGRGGRPCRRCEARLLVRAQGEFGRLTYYCGRCQAGFNQPQEARL